LNVTNFFITITFYSVMSMPSHDLTKIFHTFSCSGDKFSTETSELIVETPLEIVINRKKHVLIMFTPKMIKELVFGYIFTEGLINDIKEIEACIISLAKKEGGEQLICAKVSIPSLKSGSLLPDRKREISYSGSGISGTKEYYGLKHGLRRVKSRHRFSMDILKKFSQRLEEFQPLYQRTGGAHAAVLYDSNGNAILHSEDMARHNALDKVIGSTLIKGIPCNDKILVSSGRASLDMIRKSARAGFPVFVAMSRPTSMAVEAAEFCNITLIDLARDTNRIYSNGHRIKGF